MLDLGFSLRGGRTVLDRRVFRWPYVLTRTFQVDPSMAHMLTVIVQSSGGAINEGDRLEQRLRLEPGAAAHLTNQGASVVHRARPGMAASERVTLSVAAGAMLEYMPEPRILFPDAVLNQEIDVDCDPEGTAIIADGFTLHDPEGLGRPFRGLTSRIHVRVAGEMAMIDRFTLDGTARLRANAFGSLVVVTRQTIDAAALSQRLATIPGLYAVASPMPNGAGIGIRLAAEDLRALRAGTALAWRHLRQCFFGVDSAERPVAGGGG
ncbi:urease accessory protein UreD [Bradyrhizobium sp. AZCC 2262]|uniref:urease accessory protein UreD n=1 Tax=Bradyrhizobium sp. AZCC 2262 TaxID=3117022 RepID=UPI002FEEB21E